MTTPARGTCRHVALGRVTRITRVMSHVSQPVSWSWILCTTVLNVMLCLYLIYSLHSLLLLQSHDGRPWIFNITPCTCRSDLWISIVTFPCMCWKVKQRVARANCPLAPELQETGRLVLVHVPCSLVSTYSHLLFHTAAASFLTVNQRSIISEIMTRG